MNRSVSQLAATFLVAVIAVLAGSGRVAALDPPTPDLTGDWSGLSASVAVPELLVPSGLALEERRAEVKGSLVMGRVRFAVAGKRDGERFVLEGVEVDPPQPDMPAWVVVRGTVRTIGDPKGIGDPKAIGDPKIGDPTGRVISADYVVVFADGSVDFGRMEFVQKMGR